MGKKKLVAKVASRLNRRGLLTRVLSFATGSTALMIERVAKGGPFANIGFWRAPGPKNSGTLWGFGGNSQSQLGDGTATSRTIPSLIAGGSNQWIAVGAPKSSFTSYFSFGLRSDGTLWSWGSNVDGYLGQGDTITRNVPTQIGNLSSWRSVTGGLVHGAAIRADGTLWTWGNGTTPTYGQLGLGILGNRSFPTQVGTGSSWSAVNSSYYSTLALKTDGTLWGFGANASGTLGVGDTVHRSSPIQVGSLTTWATAAVGLDSAWAIRKDGTLWSWGDNSYGQLGLNSTISRSSPMQVGNLSHWTSISPGVDTVFVRNNTNAVFGFGLNTSYQLGLGDMFNRSSPVAIGTSGEWKVLSVGGSHTLGIKQNGTLWAWGVNSANQLGTGDGTTKTIPVQIGVGTKWVNIFGCAVHSFAIEDT